jgi:hypothetical protein
MKKNMKLWIVGLVVVVMGISVGAVFAADNAKPADKTAKAPVTATVKVKLSQDDVTKIALNAHKDAKVLSVVLNGKVYIVKISDASGNRTLNIGGNTGKVLKDVADATPVTKTTTPATKTATAPTKK